MKNSVNDRWLGYLCSLVCRSQWYKEYSFRTEVYRCWRRQASLVGQPLLYLACETGGRLVECGSFVQILYHRHGHWLTITNIGAEGDDEVLVYDGLYPTVCTCVYKQIAALLHTNKRKIKIKLYTCRSKLVLATMACLP